MKMRIVVIFAGCMLALTSSGFAQGLTGGVKLGLNVASLDIEDEDDVEFKSKTGIIAGAFVGVRVNDMFSIQPEFLFSQKGASLEGGGEEGTIKLDFFEIPVLAVV